MLSLGGRSVDGLFRRWVELLNRAIETSAVELSKERADQLRGAARRSVLALEQLRAKILDTRETEKDLTHIEAGWNIPEIPEAVARSILDELNGIIAEMEHELLVPAEQELSGDRLAEVKRSLGRAWGWIICDLQDPLWKQYPGMGPLRR